MSKVIDLSLEQLKEQVLRLERENRAACLTVEKLLKELREKNEKIMHLESLVKSAVPVVVPKQDQLVKIELEPEGEIADVQLNRLREISRERQLTLEETKMYDLLVKNKRLSKDPGTIDMKKADFRNVSPEKLLEIVGQTPDGKEKDPA